MASRAVRYLIRSVVGVVAIAGLATIGLWSWHTKVLQVEARSFGVPRGGFPVYEGRGGAAALSPRNDDGG